MEGCLISKCGYTPGKWLLNTLIRDQDGEKLNFSTSLKRALFVWIYGEGFGIPYLSLVINIIAYFRLNKDGITKWDEKLNIEVKHTRIGWVKGIIAFIILVAPSIPAIIAYFGEWF